MTTQFGRIRISWSRLAAIAVAALLLFFAAPLVEQQFGWDPPWVVGGGLFILWVCLHPIRPAGSVDDSPSQGPTP